MLCVLGATSAASDKPKPKIHEGEWVLPFRYWTSLSPVLDGTGGFDFLCEVKTLGDDVPKQDRGPFRFKSGTLSVLEVLKADTDAFPEIKSVKTLAVSGCEGLKIGDRVIVFVDSEPYDGGYVIDRHAGTNCLIGHRLSKRGDEDYDAAANTALIELVRKGRTGVAGASADELHLLSKLDPDGVREALIRAIDMGELVPGKKR